jgi:hypothetical protein
MRIVIGSSINVNLIVVTHGRIVNTIAGMDYWDMKELGAIVKRERLRRGIVAMDGAGLGALLARVGVAVVGESGVSIRYKGIFGALVPDPVTVDPRGPFPPSEN